MACMSSKSSGGQMLDLLQYAYWDICELNEMSHFVELFLLYQNGWSIKYEKFEQKDSSNLRCSLAWS